MRFYPPAKKDRPIWLARVRSLKERGQHEDSPTVLNIAAYLLALDEYCDEQRAKLKQQIRRAEDAEITVRRLQAKLAAVEARAAPAQVNEVAAIEALKNAEERHSKGIKEAHLVGLTRRRMQASEQEEFPILEGIPIARGSGKRKSLIASSASPTIGATHEGPDPEAAKGKEPLPLTQPRAMEDVCSLLRGEPTQANKPA